MSQQVGASSLSRPLREVEAYWEALRQTGDIPAKSQISPSRLDAALPHVMLLERIAPGVTRFRFGGQAFHDLLGMNAERVPLTVFFSSSCQREIAQAVEDVFQKPSVLRAEMVSKGGIGRPTLSAQMLIMPLRDANSDISHAFGALTYDGRLGRVPRQFTEVRLKTTRLILNDPGFVQSPTQPEIAYEDDQKMIGRKKTGRPEFTGRPTLRVIDGDKL